MIVRYSETEAPKFFENFNVEIQNYHSVMLEACQDIVDDLISRDIYDVSVTDFAGRLSGFKEVQTLGNQVIRKATNEIQKLVDEKMQEKIWHIGQQPIQLLVRESEFLQIVLHH